MICCVAIGALIAIAVRFWRLITFRPVRRASMFPPVATRVAPGVVADFNTMKSTPNHESFYTVAKLMVFYGLAVACYMLILNGLAFFDVLFLNRAEDVWVIRNAIYIGLIAWFLISPLVRKEQGKALNKAQFMGSMITILGIVISVLFIADLHLFQVLNFAGGEHALHQHHDYFALSNWLVHGVGLMLIVIGHWVFQRNIQSQDVCSN